MQTSAPSCAWSPACWTTLTPTPATTRSVFDDTDCHIYEMDSFTLNNVLLVSICYRTKTEWCIYLHDIISKYRAPDGFLFIFTAQLCKVWRMIYKRLLHTLINLSIIGDMDWPESALNGAANGPVMEIQGLRETSRCLYIPCLCPSFEGTLNEVDSLTREYGRFLEKGSAEAVCSLPLRV